MDTCVPTHPAAYFKESFLKLKRLSGLTQGIWGSKASISRMDLMGLIQVAGCQCKRRGSRKAGQPNGCCRGQSYFWRGGGRLSGSPLHVNPFLRKSWSSREAHSHSGGSLGPQNPALLKASEPHKTRLLGQQHSGRLGARGRSGRSRTTCLRRTTDASQRTLPARLQTLT